MEQHTTNSFINSGFDIDMQSNSASAHFWDNSLDHTDPFESALSSIVSSPAASNAAPASDGLMLRELIGRLGSICNSGDISYTINNLSTNTSCYSTPLNSPPNFVRPNLPLAPFSADPGFADRAARFSCFGAGNLRINQSFKVAGSQPPMPNVPEQQSPENGDSREGSSVSDQIPAPEIGIKPQNGRKRKSTASGKVKETTAPSTKDSKVVAEEEEPKAKKSKPEVAAKEEPSESAKSGEDANQKASKDNNSKPPEPPKDYIHVRARRGQATDSHSLAERVRREKISERMKFLQDLVPGCNKVTGKAVMLDEIINYVQSLQRQVEFLSMKLSTVNPRMDFSMEAQMLLSKEILQCRGSLPQGVYPLDSTAPGLAYGYQPQQVPCMPLPNSMDGFGEAAGPPQVPRLWEDDLQSLVQMGFGPNQPQNFHGQMKIEL